MSKPRKPTKTAIIHENQYPTMRGTCNPTPGFGAGDLRNPKALTSVKDCRLSPKHSPRIRVKSDVTVSSGTHSPRTTNRPTVVETFTAQELATTRQKRAQKNARKSERPINLALVPTML